MLGGFAFAVAFTDLLFDFFCDAIDGGVHVALLIHGKEIRSAHSQAHRAGELFFRSAGIVVFEGHTGINSPLVEVVELIQPGENMLFDGFGERDIVGGKDQFHN